MITIIFGIIIFFEFLQFLIIADVILSWLTFFGLNLRPKFLADIIDPMYEFVRKYIPTKIGMFELTPIVVLIIIFFIRGLLIALFPEVQSELMKLNEIYN